MLLNCNALRIVLSWVTVFKALGEYLSTLEISPPPPPQILNFFCQKEVE